MTENQITAIAREYAEFTDMSLVDKKNISAICECFLKYTLRRYCLVEKEKLDNIYIATIEQKKRKCWEQFCKDNGIDQEVNISIFVAFDQIFDRAYALGKQEKDADDTVIQGWVCRDKKDNALYLHVEKPYRAQSGCDVWDDPDWWESDCPYLLPLDKSLFPNLTWESDPIEVEIIIKRKKNG